MLDPGYARLVLGIANLTELARQGAAAVERLMYGALDGHAEQLLALGGVQIAAQFDPPPEKWTGLSRSALHLGGADVAQS